MKVLYSCLSQSWGGMEMFTVAAVKQLLKFGIETELLCYPESKIHVKALEENLDVHTVKASGYFHPKEILKVAKLIKKNDYSLLHTQASKDLWILTPALRLAGSDVPLFLTKQLGSFIVKKDILHRYIYKRVTVAFAISKVIESNLIETTPFTQSKIRLLHNGVDTNYFSPDNGEREKTRAEFGIADDEIVIGMLARLSKGKGHEELLEAAEELSKKFHNLKFLLVGEASRGEEDYAEKIKALAKSKNLKNVIFADFRSDTPNVLSAMDIFAFPSHSEAFGIALVEAMSMEKPCVASDSNGILDILTDGETGLLFKTGDAKDLAEKLERLILSDENRKQIGKAARKRAVKFFDIDALTEKAINYYKEFVDDNKTGETKL